MFGGRGDRDRDNVLDSLQDTKCDYCGNSRFTNRCTCFKPDRGKTPAGLLLGIDCPPDLSKHQDHYSHEWVIGYNGI
jgi:hypothetical protein